MSHTPYPIPHIPYPISSTSAKSTPKMSDFLQHTHILADAKRPKIIFHLIHPIPSQPLPVKYPKLP